ncbi:hypothetical protein VZT92_003626 [Zoarces viviparus]|uniref:Uncharacterized protein n=1 Tax=Zoarces viviparus TaxID=48416 RepID=A0AAW1FU38_ZOAVI
MTLSGKHGGVASLQPTVDLRSFACTSSDLRGTCRQRDPADLPGSFFSLSLTPHCVVRKHLYFLFRFLSINCLSAACAKATASKASHAKSAR